MQQPAWEKGKGREVAVPAPDEAVALEKELNAGETGEQSPSSEMDTEGVFVNGKDWCEGAWWHVNQVVLCES